MLKLMTCSIGILLLILTSSISAIAQDSFVFNVEAFLNANKLEKRKMIMYARQMAVILEEQYPRMEPRYSWMGITPQQQMWIEAFIQNSAFYAHSTDLEGTQYYSKVPNGQRCVYGGWISITYKNYCVHPEQVNEFYSNKAYKGIKDAYDYAKKLAATSSSINCNGAEKIACNPLLYGHIQYCAPAGANLKSINSSLACWNEASKKENQDKLDVIIERIATNADYANQFAAMMRMMQSLCVCQGQDTKNEKFGINKNYALNISYHRTCYGLLSQSKEMIEKLKTKIIPAPNVCGPPHPGKTKEIEIILESYGKIFSDNLSKSQLSYSTKHSLTQNSKEMGEEE